MINCMKEFLKEVGEKEVLCAWIQYGDDYGDSKEVFQLQKGYSKSTFTQFLRCLDFEYDCGYGGQEIYGVIWYTDKTWSERGEYDGSEWWAYKKAPEIPSCLKENVEV